MKTLDDIPPTAPTAPVDAAHEDLEAYLGALDRDANYRVERRLGSGGDGTATELVRFVGANGSAFGPFVRKRIPLETGVGTAYEDIYAAQRTGRRFLHIPRIVECYKTSFELVVISEYVPGESLVEFVGRTGAAERLAWRIMPGLCDAVGELHESFDPPIIHRDLKPANVIVSEDAVTLIDFGIARRFRVDASTDTVRFGTRAYAPPEQYGFGQTSERSDVYALGMVMLFCCTGETEQGPFDVDALIARGLSREAAAVVARACSFDPAARFASAREMREVLRRVTPLRGATGTRPGPLPAAPVPAVPGVLEAPFSETPASGLPAPQGGGEPVRSPCPIERMPRAVGIIWDVFLALCAGMAVQYGIESTLSPEIGSLAGKPSWYVFAVNWLLTAPIVLGGIYLALDRRPLARVFPRYAHRTRAADAKAICLFVAAMFVLVLAVSLATGM